MKIAELFVELGVKGAKKTDTELQAMQKGIESVGSKAKWAFAGLTAGVLGFVRAGMQGSGELAVWNMNMTLLSREIAGVFLPTIQRATQYLSRVREWFQKLDYSQQRSIEKWTLIAIGAAGFLAVLPKIIAAISGTVTAVGVLTAAIGGPLTAALVAAGVVAAKTFAQFSALKDIEASAAARDARSKRGELSEEDSQTVLGTRLRQIADADERQKAAAAERLRLEKEINMLRLVEKTAQSDSWLDRRMDTIKGKDKERLAKLEEKVRDFRIADTFANFKDPKKAGSDRSMLSAAGGAWEGLADVGKRLQSSAVKMSPMEATAKNTERTAKAAELTAGQLKDLQAAMNRNLPPLGE